MNVLTVVFGGVDHQFLELWKCPNLCQVEWGPTIVDQLHDRRDVATQITAQLITGKTWRENGVHDRKKDTYTYHRKILQRLESSAFGRIEKGRYRRHNLYRAMDWIDVASCEFTRDDLTCPSLFDLVPSSRAVYVPAYNPEPSWALGRNILDPRRYPQLGVEGAEDLLEKNFYWRKKAFLEALERESPYRLLMGQFQFIDSAQHLYISSFDTPKMDLIEAAYRRIDEFAGEIVKLADGKYERVLFVSDNGASRVRGTRPTHHNRPFYSSNVPLEWHRPNLRDFYDLILAWTEEEAGV